MTVEGERLDREFVKFFIHKWSKILVLTFFLEFLYNVDSNYHLFGLSLSVADLPQEDTWVYSADQTW